uniref:Protein kinase domain-containing protein n=1 Tax=Fagus sylvatica TaxID=28930 RepID=A0A2N9J6L2_FAGSY
MDEPEMILVYEFMVNGNLSNRLFVTDCDSDPLPWKQRLQICIGVARGLHYLHVGVKHCIINGNVKSSNILLDEKWEAKLSDFRLSKIGPPSLSNKALIRVDTRSGGKASDNTVKVEEQMDLFYWTPKCIREGTINQIIDPYLTGKIAPECFNIYMDIATSCLRRKGTQRPTICEVEVGLEHALQMQESADLDPGIGGAHQYMYPILECTSTDSPPEEDESVCESGSSTSARLSLDTATPIGQ